MKIERTNPSTMYHRPSYTQVVKVTDATLVYPAGQVAWDIEGNVVGNDLQTQARKAYQNIGLILEELDAQWSNIIKITCYIAQYNPDTDRAIIAGVMREFLDSENLPAHTLLGVQCLATREILVEIEAIIAI